MDLRDHDWKPRYATGRDDLVRDFYTPALEGSDRYDRATGFFRSSLYAITGREVARFALAGGRIRLLCSPDLAPADIQAVKRGLRLQEVVAEVVARELQRVLEHPEAHRTADVFAALIGAAYL